MIARSASVTRLASVKFIKGEEKPALDNVVLVSTLKETYGQSYEFDQNYPLSIKMTFTNRLNIYQC